MLHIDDADHLLFGRDRHGDKCLIAVFRQVVKNLNRESSLARCLESPRAFSRATQPVIPPNPIVMRPMSFG